MREASIGEPVGCVRSESTRGRPMARQRCNQHPALSSPVATLASETVFHSRRWRARTVAAILAATTTCLIARRFPEDFFWSTGAADRTPPSSRDGPPLAKHSASIAVEVASRSCENRTSTDPRSQSFNRPLEVGRVSRPACRFVVTCLVQTIVCTSACLLLGSKPSYLP